MVVAIVGLRVGHRLLVSVAIGLGPKGVAALARCIPGLATGHLKVGSNVTGGSMIRVAFPANIAGFVVVVFALGGILGFGSIIAAVLQLALFVDSGQHYRLHTRRPGASTRPHRTTCMQGPH